MSKNSEDKKIKNLARHRFLIEYFFKGVEQGYAEKVIGNYVLIKQWNGGTQRWEVAVWFKDAHERVRDAYQKGMFDV